MNLLVTGAFSCTNEQLNALESMGNHVIFMQNERDSLPCDYDWVEGVICNGLFLYHSVEKFRFLKYIQLISAGFDRVPMDYIQKNGIKIFNARGVYSIPMAEFAVSGVLQLYKQNRFFFNNQVQRRWEKHRGLFELYGKKVLIIGCGSIGNECAKRFSAFGCDVYGVDLSERQDSNYKKIYPFEQIDYALSAADIVVLTLPLTEQTRHLMDSNAFAVMKSGAILVNISRGAVVNTTALVVALQEKLGGAVLDVFETEPLEPDSPLWNMENVIITPHNSFVSEGNGGRLLRLILNNLRKEDL